MSTALAAVAGLLGFAAFAVAGGPVVRRVRSRVATEVERAIAAIEQAIAPLRRLDRFGGRATSIERTRLAIAAGLAALVVGGLLAGWAVGLGLALVAALLAPRAFVWRAERYRRSVDAGAASAARALAGALSAGRSARAAFGIAAQELDGPIAIELTRVASELELGERTEDALGSLQARIRSHRIDLVVAAVLMQRRSGGNLAALLRRIATTIAEHDRLRDEARAASAQARFTSTVVLAMPIGGLALGELASPGLLGSLARSPIGLLLVVVAGVLQVFGALLVRRLSRVPA